MSKRITIGKNGAFETVEVELSDDVFWQNNDTQPHFPVPWCTGLRMDPSKPSSSFSTFPTSSPNLPQKIVYGCAIPGHGSEQGVILVYNDFTLASLPLTATAGQTTTVQVTNGGKSPYSISAPGAPPWVSFVETTPDSSSGFSAVLTNPPVGNVAFDLNTTDGLGKNIQQQITIDVT